MSAPMKPIIIIGAGLSGLLLAQGLKRAGIPSRIFERDSSLLQRAQGFRVHINHIGSSAIKRILSPEHFQLFEDSSAIAQFGASRLNALTCAVENTASGHGALGTVLRSERFLRNLPAPPPGAPIVYPVDRTVVRVVLSKGLEDIVEYGKTFDRYDESADGIIAYFKDGSTVEGIMLVGADGARSPIRAQYLPEHKPLDSQWRSIFGKTPITDGLTARFTEDAMKWVTVIPDARPVAVFLEPMRFKKEKETALLAEGIPRPADYIYWVLGGRKDLWPLPDKELTVLSHEEAANLSLEMTKDWHPSVRALFELQDPQQSSTLRIATFGADWTEWTPSARVSLIGDAVHAMTPGSGSGANTALRSAADLCAALVEGGVTAESVGRYEREMRKYAQDAIKLSVIGGNELFKLPPLEELTVMEY